MDATGIGDGDRAFVDPSDEFCCVVCGEREHVAERHKKVIITHGSRRKHGDSSLSRSRLHRDPPESSTPWPIARCVQIEQTR